MFGILCHIRVRSPVTYSSCVNGAVHQGIYKGQVYNQEDSSTYCFSIQGQDHVPLLVLYHTIIRAAFVCVFVCVFVCSLSPPRSFDGSSPNLVGVCRLTSHLPLRGSFLGSCLKRSMGRRVNGSLSLSTILYRRQPQATHLQKVPFALLALLQSLIRRLLLLHLNGICRWTLQLLLRGSFSKKINGLTGQRVNGSNGSTGHFHFHNIIYDSRRRQAHATMLQKAHGVWWH